MIWAAVSLCEALFVQVNKRPRDRLSGRSAVGREKASPKKSGSPKSCPTTPKLPQGVFRDAAMAAHDRLWRARRQAGPRSWDSARASRPMIPRCTRGTGRVRPRTRAPRPRKVTPPLWGSSQASCPRAPNAQVQAGPGEFGPACGEQTHALARTAAAKPGPACIRALGELAPAHSLCIACFGVALG